MLSCQRISKRKNLKNQKKQKSEIKDKEGIKMDMNVLGIPQIYAYIIGWSQYDIWWALMRDTGLFYIPFAVIFARAVITPYLSQETRSGAVTAVKRLVMDVIYLLVFVYLFAVPAISINVNGIRFEGKKNGQNFSYTYSNNGTTYQEHLPPGVDNATNIKMPVMWYVTLNLFNGMVGVAYDSLNDDHGSVRQFAQRMQTLSIKDPLLRGEYQRFMSECHAPAYADYQNRNYPDSETTGIANLNKEYGETNLAFAGSKVMEHYFYPKYRAQSPVVGFPFDPNRDTILAQQSPQPKYGRPYCNHWWMDSSTGLRDRLYDALQAQYTKQGGGPSIYDNLHRVWGFFTMQNEKDAIVENYLMQLNQASDNSLSTTLGLNTGFYSEADAMKYNPTGSTMSKLGLIKNNIESFTGYITTLVNMLPLLQMMILLATFALLPIGIVISMFSFRFMMSALVFVFAVIACTYLWHLVTYADNFFISSLYESPPVSGNGFEAAYNTISNLVSGITNANIIIVNMVAGIMYLVFPSILTMIAAWGGFSVGGVIDRAVDKGNEKSRGTGAGIPVASKLTSKL